MQFSRLIVLLVAWIAFAQPVLAQTTPPTAVQTPAQQEQDAGEVLHQSVDSLRNDLDRYERSIAKVGDTQEDLVAIGQSLAKMQTSLIVAGAKAMPRLAAIRNRLAQLGPPPAEGEAPEPQALTDERDALINERTQINQKLGTLEALSVRAHLLSQRVADRRRHLFVEELSRRYDLTQAVGSQLSTDGAQLTADLGRRVTSWAEFTWRAKQRAVLAAAILIGLLAMGWIVVRRRFVAPWVSRAADQEPRSDLSRMVNAFGFVFLPSVVFWVFLGLSFLVLDQSEVLRPDIYSMLRSLLIAWAVIVLIWRLSDAIFAPQRPRWRLVRVTTRAARQLKRLVIAIATIAMVDVTFGQIAAIAGDWLPLTIARTLIASILTGALLMMIALVRPFHDEQTQDLRPWPAWVKWPVFGLGLLVIGSALLGYIGFARFASEQIVVTGAVLTTLFLGFSAAQAITKDRTFAQSRLGERLAGGGQLSETAVDQIGLVAGLLLIAAILTIGLPVLALFWGVPWEQIRRVMVRVFTDLPVGSLHLSLASVALGIVLFIAGYLLTRRFAGWLDHNVLERSRVEAGARVSIRKGMGYLGIAIAALVGVSAAGFNLSQLALVAGALSVGIGFGLQNIVNNFVSGLILLAERPFKTGDIIEAGGNVGTVTNINVRATEIQLFDRKTLILPNSELINSAVQNWMHRNTLGRVMIHVGVSYDADPRRVHDLLLEIAADHPRVLGNPEPFVAFDDFGHSAMDFKLYAFLPDIGYGLGVRTDLRMEIHQRFKREGIEIPFPQRDVNLRMMEPRASVTPVTAEGALPNEGPEAVRRFKGSEDEDQ